MLLGLITIIEQVETLYEEMYSKDKNLLPGSITITEQV